MVHRCGYQQYTWRRTRLGYRIEDSTWKTYRSEARRSRFRRWIGKNRNGNPIWRENSANSSTSLWHNPMQTVEVYVRWMGHKRQSELMKILKLHDKTVINYFIRLRPSGLNHPIFDIITLISGKMIIAKRTIFSQRPSLTIGTWRIMNFALVPTKIWACKGSVGYDI